VTVSFNDPFSDSPVALTTVVLRPGLFRIVVESHSSPVPLTTGSPAGPAEDWEPVPEGRES
jgi:hypothetical protein